MTRSVRAWRIATDTPRFEADDPTGAGAELTGGRWNRPGLPVLYASSSRALACLETVVHLGTGSLPLNRYLVDVLIPDGHYRRAEVIEAADLVGWDALPPGRASIDWGSTWLEERRSLIARVPSVVVPEEVNILINPRHPAMGRIRLRKARRWTYDGRLSEQPVAKLPRG